MFLKILSAVLCGLDDNVPSYTKDSTMCLLFILL